MGHAKAIADRDLKLPRRQALQLIVLIGAVSLFLGLLFDRMGLRTMLGATLVSALAPAERRGAVPGDQMEALHGHPTRRRPATDLHRRGRPVPREATL